MVTAPPQPLLQAPPIPLLPNAHHSLPVQMMQDALALQMRNAEPSVQLMRITMHISASIQEHATMSVRLLAASSTFIVSMEPMEKLQILLVNYSGQELLIQCSMKLLQL